MALTDAYNRAFHLCFPRQSWTPEWIEQTLHRLWDAGLDFASFRVDERFPVTWDEHMESVDFQTGETFCAQMAQLVQRGGSMWMSHEAGWPYLTFQVQQHLTLDWIAFSLDGSALEPYWKRKQEQYETPLGYLAVYQAFLEWAKVLCEIMEPLFGFGSCQGYLTNFDPFYEYTRRRGAVPQSGQLPPIDEWFSHPPLRYLAPPLLTPEVQADLLARQHWQVERLQTGGLFVTPPDPEYTYRAYGGYNRLHRRDQPTGEEQASPSVQQEQAETRRALTVFTALNLPNGIHQAQTRLSQLENASDMR